MNHEFHLFETCSLSRSFDTPSQNLVWTFKYLWGNLKIFLLQVELKLSTQQSWNNITNTNPWKLKLLQYNANKMQLLCH
jgi:hypothetical protein